MITQPFLFQLFAAEEPLTGRLQEITPQVHSWKCVYRKRWQILLWLKHCWIYTSTHCRMSSSPSIDEHKRMDLMASHLQAQINKTTSPQPPPLSALKTPQGLELWTLLKVKKTDEFTKTKPHDPPLLQQLPPSAKAWARQVFTLGVKHVSSLMSLCIFVRPKG